jgi:hypothetical protein
MKHIDVNRRTKKIWRISVILKETPMQKNYKKAQLVAECKGP